MQRLSALLFLIFLFSSSAQAAELYGLAMHGAPKYGRDFTHLDYTNPQAPKGGTLTQAAIGTFDSLNPFAIKGKAAQGMDLVYDRLMARVWDEPFTMYPLVAEKIEVPEDRSSITFHLNPRARFHDGSAITADDVLFTFETLREHGRPNMRRVYKLVAAAEKVSDRAVKFTLGPGHDRETIMILALMPVLSKSWWQGKTFDSASLDIPLSSGPYKITDVQPGRRIVYERVKDYWAADLPVNRGHYNFDRVIYDYFRDDTVAFEAFKAGDISFRREFDAGQWLKDYNFPAVASGDVVPEALPHGRPERVRSFIFNTRRAPFNDIRVRKALSLALDFNWINKNLYSGAYRQISSYYPNAELAAAGKPDAAEQRLLEPWRGKIPPEIFGPAWQPPRARDQMDLRVNLRQADRLLQDAGWTIKNGKRVNAKDGTTPLTFEIILETAQDEKIALSYKRNLSRLGIDVLIRVLDNAAFRGRLNDYDFDMALHYWLSTLSPGSEQILYWGCEAAKQPARWNYAGICDPAVDGVSLAIANAKDRADLVAHARVLDRLLTWGHYMVPLYYAGKDYIARQSHIRHPETTPLYGLVIETWWAEPGGG